MRCTVGRTLCLTGRAGFGVTGSCGPGQIEQARTLGVVELKRANQTFEDQVGRAADVAAFQPLVVLDAHARQGRDLLTAQSRHAELAVAR